LDATTRVKLSPEQETLLITLFAKAQPDNPILFDPNARRVLERIDYDFASLRVPQKTVVLVSQRAKKIDAVARAFMAEYPSAVVVHIGCGLDARFERVDDGSVEWYDLDMGPVIELRSRFFPDRPRYHAIASDAADLSWLDRIHADGRPVLVIAEGLLMYLSEGDVRALILRLREVFPGCRLVGDVFSRLAARAASRHPSLKRTGAHIGFGIDDAREVESWAPGVRLLEEWYFTNDPELATLGPTYRLVYGLVRHFKVARLAQRIVYYQL
jgi:O-methyltransferase involved in polyketide biosynthesis